DATAAVDGYFTLEDPRRLEPAERESYVETTLDSGLRLRGYIDRLDVARTGEIRVVDYKTGKAPPPTGPVPGVSITFRSVGDGTHDPERP
ncbi:MAG: putative RecB family exonuclease, partial [Pseudonocardiales bacterium]|nr:putative RecB family exonuclease [Pseudonocardiales bacterium]